MKSNNESEIHNKLNAGEAVSMNHPDISELGDDASRAISLLTKFNQEHDLVKARSILGELIGKQVSDTTRVYPPLYTNYGKNISLGERVFINHACSILDLGMVEIEDDVMIGPRVSITSENHPVPVRDRKTLVPGKVLIKKNVWIGAAVTILPGVTIGENSVVAAGAVVVKDVPANCVVAGVPAKVIKQIE
ncbi:DapH/DapD/GlmU-related protein [Limibacter armeniacum]|uniref:DapH/DapD/GlmU-related protein n=1 Tax=Limibacter armeniacum TaxID=466084 RepID=UPI002FE6619D